MHVCLALVVVLLSVDFYFIFLFFLFFLLFFDGLIDICLVFFTALRKEFEIELRYNDLALKLAFNNNHARYDMDIYVLFCFFCCVLNFLFFFFLFWSYVNY